MSTEDACKLFVAGLPDSITEDVLRQLFEATGGQVLEVSVPKDRATGRPRGFAFVTLETAAQSETARRALDGSIQAGKSISVRPFQAEAPRRSEPPRPMGAGGPGPRDQGGPMGQGGDRTLYIGNLPYDASEREIEDLIKQAGGEVARVNLPADPDGRKRGFGFVTMASAESAQGALAKLENADLRGRRLIINIAHPKGERPMDSTRPRPMPSRGGSSGYPPEFPSAAPMPFLPPADPTRRGDGARRAKKPEPEKHDEAVGAGGKRRRLKERGGRRANQRGFFEGDDDYSDVDVDVDRDEDQTE